MKFVKSRCRGKSFDVAGKRANSWHCPCSEWEGERAVVLIWWGGERVVYRLGDGCCEVRTQRNCESAYRTVPCQFVHNGTVNVRTERYVWQCVQNGIVLVRKERYCESAYRTVLWKGVQNGTLKVHREQYCESAYRTVLWKCVQNGTVKMRTERYCESAFRTVLVTVRTERYLWQCVQSVTVQVRTECYCASAYRTVLWKCLQNGTVKVRSERYLWQCIQNGTCDSAYRVLLCKCVQNGIAKARTERYCERPYVTSRKLIMMFTTALLNCVTEQRVTDIQQIQQGRFETGYLSVCTSAFGRVNKAHFLHS